MAESSIQFENVSDIFVQRQRFNEIMRRHVRADDANLSDDELARTVLNRYLKDRGLPLIDPNE
jgi:hypothetical protein